MSEIRLTQGARYDVAELRLVGWTAGNGSGHEGYSWLDYFEPNGIYKGPDQDGIEPIVEPKG